jgi:hypothetical protein
MDKTTLLYIEREEAIKSLLNVEDISVIKKIRSILNKGTAKLPAVMTIEELKAEVMEATEQLENGEGTRHEDFVKEMKSWL